MPSVGNAHGLTNGVVALLNPVQSTVGPNAGGINPTEEECNGLDDDCDSEVDEALERSCGSSVGRRCGSANVRGW